MAGQLRVLSRVVGTTLLLEEQRGAHDHTGERFGGRPERLP